MRHIERLYQASPGTRSVLILLGLAAFTIRLDSAERVLRMTVEDHGALYGAAHEIRPETPLGRGDFDNLVASKSFPVYTTAEVDGFRVIQDRRLDDLAGQLASSAKNLTAVEQRISVDLARKIDEIPRQLLTEDAMVQMKSVLLGELRSEMTTLKTELQAQINALKK